MRRGAQGGIMAAGKVSCREKGWGRNICMSAIRRHPLITFFVLTYALTWGPLPLGTFFATGPLIAALMVIPITRGFSGLKELGFRMIRWRVRWHWYALAIGVPLTVHLVTVALNVGLGAPPPPFLSSTPS